MSNVSDSRARVYVACLVAYNNGYLHGAWIDADQDADQMRGEIVAMLARSPVADAEEYAIHGYEGVEGVSISEYACIDSMARMAAFIAEHGALCGPVEAVQRGHGPSGIHLEGLLSWSVLQSCRLHGGTDHRKPHDPRGPALLCQLGSDGARR